uniref:class II glutamine amidotransferase n=1 Tax=Bifidobacterium adolescentis TaxID=1680 RepID=UPI00359CB999
MCVIATADKGAMPTVTQLAQMSEANPDGAGIAWHDESGLHRYRNPDNNKTLALILSNWDKLAASPFLLHFRLATHGAIKTENTHPFRYTLANGEHGFIAHNGIARRHTHGRYASDSRNAILAWQTGQADLTDGTQGKFAKIDQNGRIEWLYGAETIQGGTGRIKVSNTIWDGYGYGYEDGLMGYDPNDIWDEAYQTGYEDGQEELLNGAVPDWTPHARH